MERSLNVNNKTLADKLTTELEGALQYKVTDDVQLFSKDMRLGNVEYVPVILQTISSFENENRYIFNTTYQLTFKVRNSLRDDFYDDMDTFRATQLTEVIGSYIVTKVVSKPIQSIKSTDNGIDYFEYTVDMLWTSSLAKVGTAAVIKVDTVQVPFTRCDVVHDISYISNLSVLTNYRMTNDTVLLYIPLILANAKVSSLYDLINSDSYNSVHVLDIDGKAKTVVLKRGQYVYENTSTIAGMILTFETHYPRVTITLNGISLPISAYRYNGKKTIDMSGRTNDIQKGRGNGKVRTWTITFVNDESSLMANLILDGYGDTVGTTYTLVTRGATYTVELGDVTEEFTETGNMTLQCQFIEYE
jgi:hypothetical protein